MIVVVIVAVVVVVIVAVVADVSVAVTASVVVARNLRRVEESQCPQSCWHQRRSGSLAEAHKKIAALKIDRFVLYKHISYFNSLFSTRASLSPAIAIRLSASS